MTTSFWLTPEAIDETLQRYHPKYAGEKAHQRFYRVIHDEDKGGTWLQVDVVRTRGPDSRRLASRLRFCVLMCGPVEMLEHVPYHPRGQCKPCTDRWRYEHGYGQDLRDMDEAPSYQRADQWPTLDEVLVGA